MRLYLGTHHPHWLGRDDMPPLFVSANRLVDRKRLPRAAGSWALDSGGFTELRDHGRWRTTARQYVGTVRRFADEIGNLAWAAPQDWMCEPFMLGKTGLTVAQHQRLTVDNYRDLRELAPELPIIPVLQGWTLGDYRHCVDLYGQAGIDLTTESTVGVGSVCRRQGSGEIAGIIVVLAARHGLRLHGFGVKTHGLRRYSDVLVSADSMAWSYGARRGAAEGLRAPGCTHKSCANCAQFALIWHRRLTDRIEAYPPSLFTPSTGVVA